MLKRFFATGGGTSIIGTPCIFAATTNVTGSASFGQEQENITGAAGAVVTIQVTTYTINNTMGQIFMNGGQVFLNNTLNITLDGSGNGNFIARVQGDASQTGTITRAVFTITAVSIGAVGTPSTKQISKIY